MHYAFLSLKFAAAADERNIPVNCYVHMCVCVCMWAKGILHRDAIFSMCCALVSQAFAAIALGCSTPGVHNEAPPSRKSFTAHFICTCIGVCIKLQSELPVLGIPLCFVNANMLATIGRHNKNTYTLDCVMELLTVVAKARIIMIAAKIRDEFHDGDRNANITKNFKALLIVAFCNNSWGYFYTSRVFFFSIWVK